MHVSVMPKSRRLFPYFCESIAIYFCFFLVIWILLTKLKPLRFFFVHIYVIMNETELYLRFDGTELVLHVII